MAKEEMKPRYEPNEAEPRIMARWLEWLNSDPEQLKDEEASRETYSIAIPPPNVTGVLHMGHALNLAVQDTLIRAARARGLTAKWIHGTDHAGIATQTKVEQQLLDEGTSREALGRDPFVERVWRWREEFGGAIVGQQKRLGSTADFQNERFTLDDEYAQAVLTVFVALYEKGYIYRDRYLVNWDPGSRSAISDLEVEQREVTDTLYYIDYPLVGGSGSITVATVRPETMLADMAIAVNPGDERYRALIGQRAVLPLVGRELPIIADEYVKTDFGTGALKITPAHDPNDFEIGVRHGLDKPSVIGEDGLISGDAPERFVGLTVADAQRAIVAELSAAGLVSKTESYTHTVPFSQRSGSRIEPLMSLQWFMRMDELAAPAIAAVKERQIRFHPDRWSKVYLDWMENIRPWCISRQLWWGHQIPVWYRDGETYVGMSAPEGSGWQRDPDVLDTWFSSALWPFATLGWPDKDAAELRAFYPTDAMVTSRDIIFLWVARMVMMGLEFIGQIPFSDVYVHSIIQAPDGRRMSKSLGTGIDPLMLIEGGPRPAVFAAVKGGDPGEFPAYGADAVRWGLLAMSSGQDVRFNEEKIAQALQLTNKLWNAARLILGRMPSNEMVLDIWRRMWQENLQPDELPEPVLVEDRWILSRLVRVRDSIDDAIANYEFSRAALELYDFIYGELCDWYLEFVKPRLHGGELEEPTGPFLLHVLIETLQVAHPLIPFVTEEIYGVIQDLLLTDHRELLAARTRPVSIGAIDEAAEREIERTIGAVQSLRAWRDGAEVKPSAVLSGRLIGDGYETMLAQIARLCRFEFSGAGEGAGEVGSGDGGGSDGGAEPVASVAIPDGVVEVLPSPALDLEAAQAKRDARRGKLAVEIEKISKKLANEGFVSKAPAAVVAGEREKLTGLQAELDAL